jgi:hypothetical protein
MLQLSTNGTMGLNRLRKKSHTRWEWQDRIPSGAESPLILLGHNVRAEALTLQTRCPYLSAACKGTMYLSA